MSIGIIGVLSLIVGIIGCVAAHWYIGAVFCLISVILGIIGLTDYLSYKWTSIVGIVFAVIGFVIFSLTIYSDMASGKLVILYFEDGIEEAMYDQGEEVDDATESIAETDSEVAEKESELDDLLPEETVNDVGTRATSEEKDSVQNTVNENEKEPEPKESESDITLGQKNSLAKAQLYLETMPFSYTGLIQQLEFDGFTSEEAIYGADHCGADWNDQAAKKAQLYLETLSFSKEGLIEQLKFDGFTNDQAVYGAEAVGY